MKIEKLMSLIVAENELRCAADRSRPLTPAFPVCDDTCGDCGSCRADGAWEKESEDLRAEADALGVTPEQRARATRLLQDQGRVGAHARRAYGKAWARRSRSSSIQEFVIHGETFQSQNGVLLSCAHR